MFAPERWIETCIPENADKKKSRARQLIALRDLSGFILPGGAETAFLYGSTAGSFAGGRGPSAPKRRQGGRTREYFPRPVSAEAQTVGVFLMRSSDRRCRMD
jgi:hypothetical protein